MKYMFGYEPENTWWKSLCPSVCRSWVNAELMCICESNARKTLHNQHGVIHQVSAIMNIFNFLMVVQNTNVMSWVHWITISPLMQALQVLWKAILNNHHSRQLHVIGHCQSDQFTQIDNVFDWNKKCSDDPLKIGVWLQLGQQDTISDGVVDYVDGCQKIWRRQNQASEDATTQNQFAVIVALWMAARSLLAAVAAVPPLQYW